MGLELLEEGFEPLPTGAFRYRVLGLSGCRAADWLPRPEPVAWALAALMHPGTWSRAELKVECLRRVRQWEDTEFRKEVLVNWIETYVQLSGEDAAEYQRMRAEVARFGFELELDGATERFNRTYASLGLPLLDLLPAFRAAPQPTRMFFERTVHLTPEGHDVAARAIAGFLADQSLVP